MKVCSGSSGGDKTFGVQAC